MMSFPGRSLALEVEPSHSYSIGRGKSPKKSGVHDNETAKHGLGQECSGATLVCSSVINGLVGTTLSQTLGNLSAPGFWSPILSYSLKK